MIKNHDIINEITLCKVITKDGIDNKTAKYKVYIAVKKEQMERGTSLEER